MSVAAFVLFAVTAAAPATGAAARDFATQTAESASPSALAATGEVGPAAFSPDGGDDGGHFDPHDPLSAADEQPGHVAVDAGEQGRPGEDPARTQLMLSPSAHTLPQDASRINTTQLVVYQYNFGLTDDLQLGINTFLVLAASLDLKWRFLQTENFSAAALVGAGAVLVQRGNYGAYTRLVGTWHRDTLEASLGWSYLAAWNSNGDTAQLGSTMAALSWQVGARSKLMAEYGTTLDLAGSVPDQSMVNTLTWGVRFFWESFAITPGYITLLEPEPLRGGLVGIPYLDISYSF